MTADIRVVHTLTWAPIEMAGGSLQLENGTTVYFHGPGVSLINDITDALNLSVTYTFGYLPDPVIAVVNNAADISSLVPHAHSGHGEGTTFVYLHPLTQEPSAVFFRQPPSSLRKSSIFLPFTTTAWIAIFILNCFIAILVTTRKLNIISVSNFLSVAINALTLFVDRLQFQSATGENMSGRNFISVVHLVKSFFGILFISLYTAKFVSVFVLKDELVKNPEDLIKYNYAFNSYSEMHIDRLFSREESRMFLYNTTNFQINANIVKNVIGKHCVDPRQALLSLPDGFHPQALYTLNYTRELCLVSSFESKLKTPRCMYIRKGSPFREPINLKILQMIERGLNFRLQRNHNRKFFYKCQEEKQSVPALHIHHMAFGYLVLIVGACVSILLDSEVVAKLLKQ